MADAGIFVGFGNPVRGREAQAVELFNETLGWYASLQEEGEIESFEPVFLELHGGDLNGFFLVRGEAAQLAALRVDEEFEGVIQRAGLIVDKMGVVGAAMGARLERQMGTYMEAIAQFA